MKKYLILLLFLACVLPLRTYAQKTDTLTTKEFSENAFTGTQLINSQTTTIMPSNSWAFEIQHRFGKIGIDSSLTQQFLGLDLPAVMRIAFAWNITDRFYFKIGRTNVFKTYDIEGKYLLAKQTVDFKMPVSISLFFNSSIRSEKFPAVPKNSFFEDDSTAFFYKPSHRFAYNTQFIISSRISERFSMQVNPVFIYQNLATPYTDNFTLALSAGARYKIGFSSAFVVEYAHVFNNRGNRFYDPVSIGFEFGTPGHTFQLFASTASKILETQIYTASSVNAANAEFMIGFNLQRSFWRKNKSN
ncbi:MAG: hypothetical protein HND27_01155 [Bacteroidetes bacterium]|nr:hypothetical protein [Bacteroidota bacterium]MBV6461328.1 hypothetical protein [Flavobacteriales bacterium]WKZ75272.1 MAG: DUF5777 family beta-barrel protein [Vicingaceae bacterium]MCL4816539.1 hypothetical protein [Flavobacteriales bacterium]NOG94365.1 hypothetical protein [Bacteroidota bacterium]